MTTWHPLRDTAGNDKPGGFGTVLGEPDDEGWCLVHGSYTWEQAQEQFPDVERRENDIPVVIDKFDPDLIGAEQARSD